MPSDLLSSTVRSVILLLNIAGLKNGRFKTKWFLFIHCDKMIYSKLWAELCGRNVPPFLARRRKVLPALLSCLLDMSR